MRGHIITTKFLTLSVVYRTTLDVKFSCQKEEVKAESGGTTVQPNRYRPNSYRWEASTVKYLLSYRRFAYPHDGVASFCVENCKKYSRLSGVTIRCCAGRLWWVGFFEIQQKKRKN